MDSTIPKHPIYNIIEKEEEADGVAWVFTDEKNMVKLPFKFPEIGADEVRVNVTHTGLCHSDVLTVRGLWGKCAWYPLAPGHEVLGTVSRLGSNVKDFKIGERVGFAPVRKSCDTCEVCLLKADNLCDKAPDGERFLYGKFWGGYATAIQQPAQWCFKIPESLPDDATPPLLCAGATTYSPLARYVKPGMNVAIIGIGGLGHLGVQYAAALGAHTTAFSSNLKNADEIKKLGAERVVCSTDKEALKAEYSKYDVVLNTLAVGDDGSLFSLWEDITKPLGKFIQVGSPPGGEIKANTFPLVLKQISLEGSHIGSRKETNEMLEFSAKHKIVSQCEYFAFEDMPKAFDHLENGKPKFRCVVNCVDFAKKHNLYKSA
jgi:uncharacterized zinc-type alcohol dehydrogenase-like protein